MGAQNYVLETSIITRVREYRFDCKADNRESR